METGVINNKILQGELRDIFEARQCISDKSGAGNNWACGHFEYGALYSDEIQEKVRQAAEKCDSLQGFFFLHSIGGGTGSGLGTHILQQLADLYPSVFRFSTCVFPQNNDDVITSPYNSMLALNELIDHADCVLPVDNQALFDIVDRVDQTYAKTQGRGSGSGGQSSSAAANETTIKDGSSVVESANTKKKANHFEKENSIVANVINNLTCSMRFEGDLNVDMNEITMNMVPFPKMHFLQSSLSPLYTHINPKLNPRTIDQSFSDAFDRSYQLIQQGTHAPTYLSCGLIVRGPKVQISDINRNVEKLQKKLNMIHWNQEGFKVGHCHQAPLDMPYSMLALSNNTGTRSVLEKLRGRFMKIYKQRVFVHHYTKYMDISHFDTALNNCSSVIDSYEQVENKHFQALEQQQGIVNQYTDGRDPQSNRFKAII